MHRALASLRRSSALSPAPVHSLASGSRAPSRLKLPQVRQLHAALLAPGLGDALAGLPGAARDKQGHISVPVPDPRLELLAELERTKPVRAVVEAVPVGGALDEEFAHAVGEALSASGGSAELSGKLLAELRRSEAIVLAVPCRAGADADPVAWLRAAERSLVSSDLQALEQQVCKGGSTGEDAELDVAKLRKALASSKDKAVQRDADSLTRDVVAPGLAALRARLRAGAPTREARPGLESRASSQSKQFAPLDPRFEELTRGWLHMLVTWRPLLLLADVPETDAGEAASSDGADGGSGPLGNDASKRLVAHAKMQGVPCVTACLALESEVAGLKDEPEFMKDYLESFGLRGGDSEASASLRPWRSRSAEITRCIPKLLNMLTYYTAGEKEARAWMCHRVRKDHSPLPFVLPGSEEVAAASAAKSGQAKKGESDDGVPACLAARAIHTSFETRLKSVLVWKFEDLDALGPCESGPAAKERAKSGGKMKKVPAQALLEDSNVVEFVLS